MVRAYIAIRTTVKLRMAIIKIIHETVKTIIVTDTLPVMLIMTMTVMIGSANHYTVVSIYMSHLYHIGEQCFYINNKHTGAHQFRLAFVANSSDVELSEGELNY